MSSSNETLNTFSSELQSLANVGQIREKRRELLAWVREQFQKLGSLEPAEKRKAGQELNHLKAEIERLTVERLQALETAKRPTEDAFDPGLPAPPLRLGRVHPTITV